MPDKITFTSARLESFKRNGNGGEAQFSSSWNQRVAKALGWSELPDAISGANLDGDLAAVEMELSPAESELRKHGINLDITRVHKFEAVRLELEGKKGKGHRIEVRFKVSFVAKDGCRELEKYMLTIGEGKASLTVSYTAQQQLIDGAALSDEAREATSEKQDALYQ